MANWSEITREVEEKYPFLSALMVGMHAQPAAVRLPEFVKINIAAASGLLQRGQHLCRLAVLAPRLCDLPVWMAVGSTLCALRDDYEAVMASLPQFLPEQKLLLDGDRIVSFDHEDASGIWFETNIGFRNIPRASRLRLQPTSSRRALSPDAPVGAPPADPLDQLLGIQTFGNRGIFRNRIILVTSASGVGELMREAILAVGASASVPAPRAVPGDIPALVREALTAAKGISPRQHYIPPGLVNLLLRLDEMVSGQQASRYIDADLQSSIRQACAMVHDARRSLPNADRLSLLLGQASLLAGRPGEFTPASPVELRGLFQWGALRTSGEVHILTGGQIAAEPALLVAPDLLSVRSYLHEHRGHRALVILDGARTFRNKLDVLDEVLEQDSPVLACVEQVDDDSLQYLIDRSFALWNWGQRDIQTLQASPGGTVPSATGAFALLQNALRNFANQKVSVRWCDSQSLQEAADLLQSLVSSPDTAGSEVREVEGYLYNSLLTVARLLRPFSSELDPPLGKLRQDLESVQLLLNRNRLWLDSEVANCAESLISRISLQAGEALRQASPKAGALQEIIDTSDAQSIAVVVKDADEVLATREYWQKVGSSAGKRVEFFCPASFNRATDFDLLVTCGWLGGQRMRRLIDGCATPVVQLLLYPFEQRWYRSASRRWNMLAGQTLSPQERAHLLGISRPLPEPEVPEAAETPSARQSTDFEITEFELALRARKISALAAEVQHGEERVEARLVDLSEDYFGLFTSGHRIPVVTEVITGTSNDEGHISFKVMDELSVGDYVVFREGSQRDVIREIADDGLIRAGREHVRELSGLWRAALQRFTGVTSETVRRPGGHRALHRAITTLQRAGIARTSQTLRGWLTDDSRIFPRDDGSLELIASITGDAELQNRLPELRQAISEVVSAHHQAAAYLVTRLLAALPEQLVGTTVQCPMELSIDRLGRAMVVRVEDIASETLQVAASRANCLLREEN